MNLWIRDVGEHGTSCSDIKSLPSKIWGVPGGKVDPAGFRETEFISGKRAAGTPIGCPAARLRIRRIAHQNRRETGSTTWVRDCHGSGGGACDKAHSGPDKGCRHVPSEPLRGHGARLVRRPIDAASRQSSSRFRALKSPLAPLLGPGGRLRAVPALQIRQLCLRVHGRLALKWTCWTYFAYDAPT
jgi:hypothetical protein